MVAAAMMLATAAVGSVADPAVASAATAAAGVLPRALESLTLPAAWLMGLAASGHCLLMCGGIAGASGVVAMPGHDRRQPLHWLLASQLGRITSYSLAGLLAGGVLGGFVALFDLEAIRIGLRVLTALALALAAAVVAGWLRDPGRGPGALVWRYIGPLARRLLPLRSALGAFGFGMIWGWMPCGFVYSVLVVAALAADPWRAAAIMALFGLGTLPAMLALAAGVSRLPRLSPGMRSRQLVGALLLGCAALTLASPWLPIHGAGHAGDHGAGPIAEPGSGHGAGHDLGHDQGQGGPPRAPADGGAGLHHHH